MIPDFPELPVHHVEVVEEPLLGLGNLTLLSHRLDDVPVPGEKHLPILADAVEELASRCASLSGELGSGQALGVLLEPFDAEHLGADRLVLSGRSCDQDVQGVQFELRIAAAKRVRLIKES